MSNLSASRSPVTARCEYAVWLVAVVLAAALMTSLHLSMNTPFKFTTFEQLVHFEAGEPFQHRILLPALVAGLQLFLPLGEKLLFGVFELLAWIALILLAHRALVIFAIGGNDRWRRVLAFSVTVPMFLHLMAPDLWLIPAFVIDNGRFELGPWEARPLFYYVYDLPAALFTLAMTLVLACHAKTPSTRDLLPYLLLFTLATINRETSILMLGFFVLLYFRSMPWPRLFALLALQCALYAMIQLPLHWLFADHINPSAALAGTQYESHFLLNLSILSGPAFLITFVARFAAGLYIPVLLRYRALDRRLALVLVGFGLPLIFLAMLGGIIREYRIFIEIVPLIWLAALQVIAAPSVRSQPVPP